MPAKFLPALVVLLTFASPSLSMAGQPRDNALSETYVQYEPAAIYLFGAFAGAECRTDFIDRASKTAIAYLIDFGLTQGIKHFVKEERPDGSDMRSFPSGHTSTAFLAAELVRQDYPGALPLALAYGGGIYTGTMRVVHNRHWWWDAVAGAAAGVGSALAAAALQPLVREHIIDPFFSAIGLKQTPNVAIVPCGPDFSGASMVFALEF